MDKTLSAADLPRLVVELPDGKEVHHSIAGSEVTIGRDPSNRITIADHFVSKFHAKLLVSNASMTLVDLASANKTYVNDRPIKEAPVRYGDEIRFAGVRCRLLAPENMEAAAPPARPVAPPAPAPPAPGPAARPEAPAPSPTPARATTPPRAKPAPRPASPPAAKRAGAGPPPIEADPMKRLLRIGGLLILVSAALAVLLRVLLVPSETAPTDEASSASESTANSENIATTTAPAPPAESAGASVPATSSQTNRRPTPNQTETAEGYFDQALSYLDTGRLKDARIAFQKVLELEPDNTRARTRLSLLEEEIAQKAELHFGNARQAFQYLRYEEAIAEWEMFLTLADPGDVRYQEAQQGIAQAKAKLH